MVENSLPNVSIITLNFNGKSYLGDLLKSLQEIDYPKEMLEIIVADNGSSDGSVELVREKFPEVTVLEFGENLGFAGGNNAAAKAAKGQYLAFINNDMRVDPYWLLGLVEPIGGDPSIVSTGSKILNWDGDKIDFVGGLLNFYGHGFQIDYSSPDVKSHDEQKSILFACGGSMLVRKDLFLGTGGFDSDYFAYFEDVDLGWRLWIMGHRVSYAPKSVAYHRGHGTASRLPNHRVRVLLERNALLTIYKNYDEHNLQKILPAALMLATERALVHGGVDVANYRIDAKDGHDESEVVSKLGMSHLVAIDDFIKCLPSFGLKRQVVQGQRKRADNEILGLFGTPFQPNCLGEPYANSQAVVAEYLGVNPIFAKTHRPRVLMFCGDVMGTQMAGPAIRALELSKVLSRECDVTLVARGKLEPFDLTFKYADFDDKTPDYLQQLVNECDVIIASGHLLRLFPFLAHSGKPLVIDLYGPFVLENLEVHSGKPMTDQIALHNEGMSVLIEQLQMGDFFICASERQKDYWLGMLTAAGRINPAGYVLDPTADGLIGIVPFGLPSEQPVYKKGVLKGVIPGIEASDKVLLWGGGIWDWFDPITLLHAMKLISETRTDVKLFFMSRTHPNADVAAQMSMPQKTVALAGELGLLDKSVFFSDRWIPYAERENYLLEADLAVGTHRRHIETRYSFRTRLLDCIWAGLPIVSTEGDLLSEVMEVRGLGRTVKPEDPGILAKAILELLEDVKLKEHTKDAFQELAREYRWETVAQSLVDFCRIARKRTLDESLINPNGSIELQRRLDEVQRRAGQLERELAVTTGELNNYRDLVNRFKEGKLMRIMEKIHDIQLKFR